jgi:catechol 2,3-dioxygenase-like lactoylglutathione lyase family enzyme
MRPRLVCATILLATRPNAVAFTLARLPASSAAAPLSRTLSGRMASEASFSDNQLLHAMLRVRNVNATIEFWEGCGAKVLAYNKAGVRETAFVGFGEYRDATFFAFEITAMPSDEVLSLGTAVDYIGTSKTLPPAADGVDPDGIRVQYVASASTLDPISRIVLHSTDLDDTSAFYTGVLGMEKLSQTATELSLRYEKASASGTCVSTSLVFTKVEQELVMGNCFDHMAVMCRDVEEANKVISESSAADAVFMPPTNMFGSKLMGLKDPSGFNLYLVEEEGFKRAT